MLLNNAGILGEMNAQSLGDLDYQQFAQVMAVNVYAPMAMAEADQGYCWAHGRLGTTGVMASAMHRDGPAPG